MAADALPYLSADEYLKIERAASFKSEYRDGQMYAMSGASFVNTRILGNLNFAIESQLRSQSSPCSVATNDLRVHIPATGLYTYPDLVATCQDPKFIDSELDTLLNPILIIEILSQSTGDYDRGGKLSDYRSIKSLTEYLTVAQDKIHIEQWNLIQGHWSLSEYRDPEVTIALHSLGIQVQVSNVYVRCNLAPTN